MKPKHIIIGSVAALAISGCGTVAASSAGAARVQSVTQDNTFGMTTGEVLAPPPSDASPALSATAAYDDWLNKPTGTPIPDIASVQLGSLTVPVGPAAVCQQPGENCSSLTVIGSTVYREYQQLVYAFEWSDCPGQALTPECQSWEFVDANTGADLGGLSPRPGYEPATSPSASATPTSELAA